MMRIAPITLIVVAATSPLAAQAPLAAGPADIQEVAQAGPLRATADRAVPAFARDPFQLGETRTRTWREGTPSPAPTGLRARVPAITADLGRRITAAGAALPGMRGVDARFALRIALLFTLLLTTAAAWRAIRAPTARPAPARPSAADAAVARIRRARGLASDGLDADAVARQAGIARDVAVLLVARNRPDERAAPGTLFRAAHRREPRSGQ